MNTVAEVGPVVEPVEWRAPVTAPPLEEAERIWLRMVLERALAEELDAAGVADHELSRLRVRAAITDLQVAAPTLNVLTTGLLLVPVDRGGVAVEIEARDLHSGDQVAVLTFAGNGRFRPFRAHFTRLGHAELMLQEAAAEFRQVLTTRLEQADGA